MQRLSPDFVAATRRTFGEQGYLFLDGALSLDEVERLRAAVEALNPPPAGVILPLVDKGDAFIDMVDHPRTLPAALALIGGAVQVLNTNVTSVPPGAPPGGWHEDGPAWPYPAIGGQRALLHLKSCFFLSDLAGQDRGNFTIIPGSHLRPFPRRQSQESFWKLPDVMQVQARAGDVMLFHNGLWHTAAANQTDKPRRIAYCTYCPSWHRPHDYTEAPAAVLRRIEELPEARRPMLRQLLGAYPAGTKVNYYFPAAEHFPGLGLVEREG